jgi:hypothetical protein
VIFLNQS